MSDFFIETNFYRLKLEDDVLHLTYIKGPITLSIAKDIVEKRGEITKGQPVLLLVDDTGLRSIDREAREYFASDEGIQGVKASAFVVSSAFAKYLATFFLRISVIKAYFPVQVFSSHVEARKWLKSLP